MDSDTQTSSMSLFHPPPTEKAVLKHSIVEYRPVSQIAEGSTIEFNIPGTTTQYVNLKKSRLHVKCKLTKADKTPVDEENLVGLVNLSLHALFRQIDVMLQQKVVSPDVGTNYPYKALIDVLLHTATDVNQSQIQAEFFFKDEAGLMDATDPQTGGNSGLLQRYAHTSEGQTVSLEGPLYVDICQQDRNIINGVPISVKLYPSSDAFRLMAKDDELYKVIITDAVLKVYHVEVNPEVILAHNEALKKGNVLLPIRQSEVKAYAIAKGSFTHTVDGMFSGEIPTSIVVGLVSSAAYAGSYKKNYANFKNYDLNYLDFSVDGNSLPGTPFQPDYKSGNYTPEFLSLFYDRYPDRRGIDISIEDYLGGYSLYVFNIADAEGDVLPNTLRGHSRLAVRFGEGLKEATTLIVYSQFERIVQIDQARNVILP